MCNYQVHGNLSYKLKKKSFSLEGVYEYRIIGIIDADSKQVEI